MTLCILLFRFYFPSTLYIDKQLPSVIVAEWLEAWDTLTMFEAAVCGRS